VKTEANSTTDLQPPGFFRRHRGKLLVAVAVLVLLAASPFLMLFGSIAADALKERRRRLPFDSAAWKTSLSVLGDMGDTAPIRLRMVDDLLRRQALVGKSREELTALLGTPPKTNYFQDYQLVYWLGPERGFMSIDSEWLAVRLGSDDRVSEARIVRD